MMDRTQLGPILNMDDGERYCTQCTYQRQTAFNYKAKTSRFCTHPMWTQEPEKLPTGHDYQSYVSFGKKALMRPLHATGKTPRWCPEFVFPDEEEADE